MKRFLTKTRLTIFCLSILDIKMQFNRTKMLNAGEL